MKFRKMVAAIMTVSMAATMMPTVALAEEIAEVVTEVTNEVAEAAVAKVGETTYETLEEAIAAAEEDATVTLLKSTEGPGVVIDKDITIDFGGKTYTFTTPAVGSTGTTTNGFQILEGNDVTLMDGALEVADANKGEYYILIQNYADLTVTDMKLDGENLDRWSLTDGDSYVLSNNCGTVSIEDTTIVANDDGDLASAFDACKFSNYDAPEVTVDDGCKVYGGIEVSPEATLVIEGGSFTDLANAVKYAKDNATIKLLESVEGPGIVIDKDITIDFNKKTYDIVGPAVGSAGTTTLGFQILKNNDVTLENGTITESTDGALEQPKAVKMLVQNYANLTLVDMVLDGSELGGSGRYVLSNNSGNITITKNTELIADTANKGIAFDVCKYASYAFPTVTFDANFTGGVKGAFEVSEGLESNLAIHAGHFTQNPADYVVAGKAAVASTKTGYNYMIGEKQVEADTEFTVVDPEVSVGNTGLDPDVVADAIASEETVKDLSALAGSMANDDSVITDAVVKAAATTLETDEVTITVETYLEVRVESVTTKENGTVEMTLEITPKYNLVAEAEGKAPVKVAEGQTMEVAKGEVITLVVPVPDSFTEGSKLYVRHVKSNGKVYMYETTVANGKATFENPNGFSTFVLTTAAPAAKIGEVGYVTLAEAVADVENGQTIVLQKDCDETVTVSRDVTFTLDVNDKTFDGAIEAGANTTVTVEDGKYTFDYTAPAKKSTTKKYDVVVKSDDHGKATVNDTYAKRGQEITITVTPDKGYELDKLTVIDAKGNEIDVEKTKNGKYTFVMPKADVTVKASFEKEVDAEAPAVEDVTSADADKTTLVLTIDQRIYKLDGNYVVNDVAPVIADARTFLPIRLVAEALGATVAWDEAVQSVTIVDADTTIVIYIGQAYATVNGVPVQLDAPAFIANGRTYLPVRFVAENLGATVSWDADTKEVTIIG